MIPSNNQIQWIVEDNPNDQVYSGNPDDPVNGDEGSFYVVWPTYYPNGERSGPMSYKITAKLTVGSIVGEETIFVTQHNLDDLRQEYWDRDVFINQMKNEAFDQTDPIMYPNLVNKAGGGVDIRHQWWIVAQLYLNAYDLDKQYLGRLSITSGYRCPYGNSRVGGELDSNHMKGVALDFQQGNSPGQARSEENQKVSESALRLHRAGTLPASEILLHVTDDPVPAYCNPLNRYCNCLINGHCPVPIDGVPNYDRGHVAWQGSVK